MADGVEGEDDDAPVLRLVLVVVGRKTSADYNVLCEKKYGY